MIISTRNLAALPDIETLRKRLQSIAMLDAILSSDGDLRPEYDYQKNWAPGEEMANFDNMQGDHFFAFFDSAGCFLKGFAHEAPMTPFKKNPPTVWPGMFRGMPSVFEKYRMEQEIEPDEAITFCIWRLHSDSAWHRGDFELPPANNKGPLEFREADLSGMLLTPLGRSPEQWAEFENENRERFENPVNPNLVRDLFSHVPLNETIAFGLHPECDPKKCREAAFAIGYPLQADGFYSIYNRPYKTTENTEVTENDDE